MKQIFNETIFYAVSKKSYQSSFTSFTTYPTLAITILKLLCGPSESARVFCDPFMLGGGGEQKHLPP